VSNAAPVTPPRIPISTLSFLTSGNFPDDAPYAGLEQTLSLFELGEAHVQTPENLPATA